MWTKVCLIVSLDLSIRIASAEDLPLAGSFTFRWAIRTRLNEKVNRNQSGLSWNSIFKPPHLYRHLVVRSLYSGLNKSLVMQSFHYWMNPFWFPHRVIQPDFCGLLVTDQWFSTVIEINLHSSRYTSGPSDKNASQISSLKKKKTSHIVCCALLIFWFSSVFDVQTYVLCAIINCMICEAFVKRRKKSYLYSGETVSQPAWLKTIGIGYFERLKSLT